MSPFAPLPGFAPAELGSLVRRRVVEEHASEAAFLWLQREAAAQAPHVRLSHLQMLDARLQAHLAGLRNAAEEGLRAAQRLADPEDAGSLFVLARCAFDSQDPRAMSDALSVSLAAAGGTRAVAAALGWGLPVRMQPLADRLVASPVPEHRAIGSSARVLLGVLEPTMITRWVTDPDDVVRATGLHAIGASGDASLQPLAQQALNDTDLACAYAAAWSLAVRGDEAAGQQAFAMASGLSSPLAREAVELAMRRASPDWARSAIRRLAASPGTSRLAVVAAGAFGDPMTVPWLIDCCGDEALAPVAGEAIATISGADLRFLDLDRDPPESVDLDAMPMEDRELPWPDGTRLMPWWQVAHKDFVVGQRYLAGQPIAAPALSALLRSGYQRQRAAAAIELAALRPRAPMFRVRMRADRQMRELAA